ncbi:MULTISPECIES: hypothetical protein [Bacillus cereus group]|uniref:hypothetical protein n=1 Tax=Bacillus cereus group TaxID=86661 RepID=UPI0007FB52FB|nr:MULTISPECIES: hypothetical protein [Bacillus cereus group]MCP1399590.1 hypothetical protein [Bacillus cereus]OBW85283.1 hypothetical protein A9L49_27775 [Bacillus cereus]PDX92528.1 hypothetical protein COM78_23110 [Bacillus thuringiensis]PES49923.1 hypothetical protein CN499_13690 [Bacillus thuringiensis]PFB90078.1 hypothetical protein CN302_31870 [Bacillus thuringiensis]
MQPKKEHIYHFTNVLDFEYICLEKKGFGFPELEEVMFNYVLFMPQGTLEFKECWISREYVEGEELRTVQVTFEDSKINKAVRLWGSKRNIDGKVLAMTMDFLNLETKELEYEMDILKVAQKS